MNRFIILTLSEDQPRLKAGSVNYPKIQLSELSTDLLCTCPIYKYAAQNPWTNNETTKEQIQFVYMSSSNPELLNIPPSPVFQTQRTQSPLCSAVPCSAVVCSAVPCCAVACSAAQYRAVQYCAVQYRAVQYHAVQ